jgi:hypothetical protein
MVFEIGGDSRAIDWYAVPREFRGLVRFASRDYLEMCRADRAYGEWRDLDPQLGIPDAAEITDLAHYLFADYWAAGAIVSAYVLPYSVEPRALGLYEYGCSFSGPYHRAAAPTPPLLVADLPEVLRAKLGAVELPLSFAATEAFDPDDLVDCQRYRD